MASTACCRLMMSRSATSSAAAARHERHFFWLLALVTGLVLPTIINLVWNTVVTRQLLHLLAAKSHNYHLLLHTSSSIATPMTTSTTTANGTATTAAVNSTPTTGGSDSSPIFSRIVLMGQFNYIQLPNELIVQWDQTMKQVGFAQVLIRGEFTNKSRVAELQALGLNVATTSAISNSRQNGFFSPYINLRDVLLELRHQEGDDDSAIVDGVLYLHDDSIPNLQVLGEIFRKTKNQVIVGTDLGRSDVRAAHHDASYENPRLKPPPPQHFEQQWRKRQMANSYRMYPNNNGQKKKKNSTTTINGAFRDVFGEHSFDSMEELNTMLQYWGWRMHGKLCANGQWEFAKDVQHTQKYQEKSASGVVEEKQQEGFLYFPSYTQADFLYMPLKYAQEYAELATLLYEHGVWLECAVPTIVDQLMHLQNATTVVTPLCTHWGRRWRGKYEMIHNCSSNRGGGGDGLDIKDDETSKPKFGVYHPIKIGPDGVSWQKAFNEINGNWTLL